MFDREKPHWIVDHFFLVTLFLVTSYFIFNSSSQLSATFDEPFYLDAGLTSWRTGSNKMLMKAGTMPLPIDLATLPLFLIERFRGVPFQPATEIAEMLTIARMGNLVFWYALLAYAWRLGGILGGPWAGRAAALLTATEPNLLAHAGLATTDIAVTAGVLAATVHFISGRGQSWRWRVLVPGIAYGVALLCKASALAFVPLIWATIGFREMYLAGRLDLRTKNAWWETLQFGLDFAGQLYIAFVVTFVYCGSDWKTERTFVEWTHALPEGGLKSTMVPISENLKIFTNAGEALAQQIKHNFRGHGSYVMGQWYERAVWYYFPVAIAAKLTIPALILIAASVAFRRRTFFGPAGWAAFALLLFSLNCRVQIGIRLVLPLVALLLVAGAIAFAPKSIAERGRARLRFTFLLAIILCQAILALANGPDRLRHFNPLFGGAERGHEVLSDSNSDWGQGLLELETWQRSRSNSAPIAIWYFGTDPRINQPAFKRAFPLTAPATSLPDDLVRLIDSDFVAVSTTILYGNPNFAPAERTAIEWLKSKTPVAKVGPFLVYQIR